MGKKYESEGMTVYDLAETSEIIERIVVLVKRRGYTQEQFEAMVGLSRNRISKWVGGHGEPTARQLWRMAAALGVTADYFLSLKPVPEGHGGHTKLDLVFNLCRELGADEAFRRLMLDHRDHRRLPDALEETHHARNITAGV
jgi:transcriptional regulator with XRE-family HTH domain